MNDDEDRFNYLRERKAGENINEEIGFEIANGDEVGIGDEITEAETAGSVVGGTEFENNVEDEEEIGEGAEESDEDAEGDVHLHAILFADDGEIEIERVEEEGGEAGIEEDAVPSVDEFGFGIKDLQEISVQSLEFFVVGADKFFLSVPFQMYGYMYFMNWYDARRFIQPFSDVTLSSSRASDDKTEAFFLFFGSILQRPTLTAHILENSIQMAAKSYSDLLELSSQDKSNSPQVPRDISRVMSDPVIMFNNNDDASSSESGPKLIIVANFLPLKAEKDTSGRWRFSYDEDSIYLQLRDGIPSDTKVVYAGCLTVDVDASEEEQVSQELKVQFKCYPIFLPSDLKKNFYNGFCKQYLWPLFHSMLPMNPAYCNRYDGSLWRAYVNANKKFYLGIKKIFAPDDYVWVHDYHLMLLPTLLRMRFITIKLGFFLHSPFPSSEIFKTLPVRNEILRAFLNSDLIGFHTFDYARHFLSCCSRMFGLEYESKRGYIGIDYFGRTINIKILPAGIHIGRLQSSLNHPSSCAKAREIREQIKGRKLVLGVDDMDIFKGIGLKLLAIEQLLEQCPQLQGELVVVQIVNPPRSTGRDVEETKKETYLTAKRINERFGVDDYEPIIIIDHPIPPYEKAAYYALAECCIVNAVRDGMNLIPYMYVVCRQGTPTMDEALEIDPGVPHTSALVVSEFIGCSPSLSGAFRVNPWDVNAVAEALSLAINMPSQEKQLRHAKHYQYVSSHDVAYWARSFMQDLQRSSIHQQSNLYWGLGFGLKFRVLSLPPSFRNLDMKQVVSAYKKANHRAIFLDYDGTLVPKTSFGKRPSPEVISLVNILCNDPQNTVFIVSGRGKTPLSEWFDSCEDLGIAAEHGLFMRWDKCSRWETSDVVKEDFSWKSIVEPVMQSYTELTDGSYIETKESGLVWHYCRADSRFGSWQAKELLDQLESVLANEPAIARKGQYIVEVKPRGINKGQVIKKVLSTLTMNENPPDFVLCIGDDRSDEDMFAALSDKAYMAGLSLEGEVFACTVGQKPSKAMYYVDDIKDVKMLLQGLVLLQVPKEVDRVRYERFAWNADEFNL
ncbi:putative alpha,alpha-trehalose-phosphate synthase [UDP-forming] 9 [Senna tora]|uniref:Putative alpha,alpha-trehalose-phosphate synthase [UDP-forming] 9 n=1 Tax=Senna tora TaxID=362788 RepID=A0A834W518_9FABA|nr:putative alpha,alpha-trehalose-phosphate synthase [UDP-forming] 9 [Senna tora]